MFVESDIREFLDALKSESATPGGGAASALSGAMSAALLSMVMRISIRKIKDEDVVEELQKLIKRCDRISSEMAQFIDRDIEAFNKVMDAYKLPKSNPEEKQNRKAKIQIALKGAALVPLNLMESVKEIALCGKKIVDIVPGSVISDIGVSALLANSALEGAYYNVKINLKYIKDSSFNEEIAGKGSNIFSETKNTLDSIKQKIDKIVEGS